VKLLILCVPVRSISLVTVGKAVIMELLKSSSRVCNNSCRPVLVQLVTNSLTRRLNTSLLKYSDGECYAQDFLLSGFCRPSVFLKRTHRFGSWTSVGTSQRLHLRIHPQEKSSKHYILFAVLRGEGGL